MTTLAHAKTLREDVIVAALDAWLAMNEWLQRQDKVFGSKDTANVVCADLVLKHYGITWSRDHREYLAYEREIRRRAQRIMHDANRAPLRGPQRQASHTRNNQGSAA